ncbi:MAG: glycine/betaine ABC transporter substrate-binding protein, partial [Alphaproteobacteria bacterium]|nr:glycine/betaine ABC transporter substrate-binding protein [Alphaproteobacteria bacterium]
AAFLKETGADKDIRMVESSTNAMLAEVERNKGGYIVYLAWEPHWMSKYDPQYLDGGDKWMGANQGSGLVNTLGRKDFKSDCPNLARFFKNFVLDINEENKLINAFEIEKKPVDQVVKNWLKANPTSVAKWLDGVKTFDDGDSMAAVKKSLGM